jgi:hypothetical protein
VRPSAFLKTNTSKPGYQQKTGAYLSFLSYCPFVRPQHARLQLTAADLEQMIKWLAELWLTDDDVRKMISEKEWLKFTESVKQAAKQLINN